MIRRTLLVAWQEFVKYVTRRGFLISLLMVPAIMVISIAVPRFTATHPRSEVLTVVDLAGGYAEAIAAAVARNSASAELDALAEYAKANIPPGVLKRKAPDLDRLFAQSGRVAAVKEFAASGGWQSAFARLSPLVKPGSPAFDPPQPQVVLAPVPQELIDDFSSGRRDVAKSYLDGRQLVTAMGRSSRLDAIVVIPKGFGPGSAVQAEYWSLSGGEVQQMIRWALTDAFRLKVNQALVPPEARAKVTLDVDAALRTVNPEKGHETGWKDRVAQLVPMGLAMLLFMVAFTNAALLLQSVVEEKSTRMVEVLLSCASPTEIMTGKLVGVTALALLTIAVWAGLGLLFVAVYAPTALAIISAGLAGILPLLPLLLVYFLCGLLIYGSLFLGIGATTNSLPDAQALLGPATMIIIMPMMLLGLMVRDPNGMLTQIISWIPIYTPFFMLVRLPFHPAPFELWVTAGLTILTAIFLVRQMGRVFARNVLTTERPPSFGALLRQVFSRAKAR